jgi:hypothetical protein
MRLRLATTFTEEDQGCTEGRPTTPPPI